MSVKSHLRFIDSIPVIKQDILAYSGESPDLLLLRLSQVCFG